MSGDLMRRIALITATLSTVVALTGCDYSVGVDAGTGATASEIAAPSDTAASVPASEHSNGPTEADTALAALATLPVKGRAPMTGYDRDHFGQEWDDSVGDFPYTRNGCDTRNDILARDLQRETVETGGCDVASGILAYDPYSGVQNYYFDSTDDEYATDLDIEHIVALGNVWVTGGQQLTPAQRAQIANDPINLMAVNPSLNRQKGDADFATWLPPNKGFWCSYAARQIRVKAKYGLWVTAPEKAAMERVLATCPDEPLMQPDPQDGHTADSSSAAPDGTADTDANQPTDAGAAVDTGSDAVAHYANCDAVRAADAAPIRRGDPGWGEHLDRDGDGSACE